MQFTFVHSTWKVPLLKVPRDIFCFQSLQWLQSDLHTTREGTQISQYLSCFFCFFPLLCPPQMTEQRKNKQRLGLLGPPQANHLTHWAAPPSNATATWLQTRSKDDAETQKTTTIKTIHGFTFDYWCPNARGDNGFLSFLFCHGIQTVPIFYVASRSSLHPLPARRRCAWWMIGQARSTHLPVLSCARPGGGRHVSLLERPRCWRIGKRTRGSGVGSVFETLGAFVLHGEVGGPPFFTFLKKKNSNLWQNVRSIGDVMLPYTFTFLNRALQLLKVHFFLFFFLYRCKNVAL